MSYNSGEKSKNNEYNQKSQNMSSFLQDGLNSHSLYLLTNFGESSSKGSGFSNYTNYMGVQSNSVSPINSPSTTTSSNQSGYFRSGPFAALSVYGH